jgi:hypothetical protein
MSAPYAWGGSKGKKAVPTGQSETRLLKQTADGQGGQQAALSSCLSCSSPALSPLARNPDPATGVGLPFAIHPDGSR